MPAQPPTSSAQKAVQRSLGRSRFPLASRSRSSSSRASKVEALCVEEEEMSVMSSLSLVPRREAVMGPASASAARTAMTSRDRIFFWNLLLTRVRIVRLEVSRDVDSELGCLAMD